MEKSNLEASFNRLLLKQITTLYLSQFTIDAHIFLYLAEQANYNCHLHYYYHWNIFAILASCTRIELSSWFFKMKRMSHSRYTLLINWLIKKIIDNFRVYEGVKVGTLGRQNESNLAYFWLALTWPISLLDSRMSLPRT